MANRTDRPQRHSDPDYNAEGEFRGTTRQALADLRDDIIELKQLMTDSSMRTDQKVEMLVKMVNDREDRFELRYMTQKDGALLFNQVEKNTQEIAHLKGWRFYIVGAFAVLMALITFFGEQIRSSIFR